MDLTAYPDSAYGVKVLVTDDTGLYGFATVRVIKTANDVGTDAIISPADESMHYTGMLSINARIKNYGPNTQNSFDARCVVTKVLPGGETTVFEDDFETDKGWTHQNTGGNAVDEWERGTPSGTGAPTPHSGSNVWATKLSGNYAIKYAAALISPEINLAGYDYAVMTYWQWVDMETGTTSVFDGGLIEISTNGGTSWTQIDEPNTNPMPYYNGTISSGYQNPLAGKKAFSGRVQSWVQVTVNLTNWVGNTVKVRFNFGSDDSITYLGWYIDDVVVKGIKNVIEIEKYNQTQPTNAVLTQGQSVDLQWSYDFAETGRYRILVRTELGTDVATGNDARQVYITVVPYGGIIIEHTPVTSAQVNQPIDIYANISSSLPLTDVKVYYMPVGSNTSLAIAMTLIAGNNTNGTWYVQIPAQSSPGTLYYHIWATDGNNSAALPQSGDFAVVIQPVSELSMVFAVVAMLFVVFVFRRRR
jgi:hypothetical protein